ncbi:MAG: helix-turn-helix domain-containing protein [Gammaproteobacteria bacterium]|nr:helix-turn-helix domain-containing protein [Gammaproteobacteria bacterium]
MTTAPAATVRTLTTQGAEANFPDTASDRVESAVGVPTPRLLRRGEHLYCMGDQVTCMYIVRAGALRSYTIAENGDQQIIDFYLPGDVLGFDALADGVTRTSAQALDTTSVTSLSFDRLFDPTEADHAEAQSILKKLSELKRREQELVFQLAQQPARQRLAWFLLRLSRHYARRQFSATRFTLPMSRNDIANYLGLAMETVCREISRLRDAGVIGIERRQISICDMNALRAEVSSPIYEPGRIVAVH